MIEYVYIAYFNNIEDDGLADMLTNRMNEYAKRGFQFNCTKYLGEGKPPYQLCFVEMIKE